MQLNCGPLACVLLQSGDLWDAANAKPNTEQDGCVLAAVAPLSHGNDASASGPSGQNQRTLTGPD